MVEAAGAGQAILRGGLGVGKSWAIRQVAYSLKSPHSEARQAIVLRVAALPVQARRQLKGERGLNHGLPDILNGVVGDGADVSVADRHDAAVQGARGLGSVRHIYGCAQR